MRTFLGLIVLVSNFGLACAESVPSKLVDQFNSSAVRAERSSVNAASDAAARGQREAVERANREAIEHQNLEAFKREQRAASERLQREAQERADEQQRLNLERARQRQLSTMRDFNFVTPGGIHREWDNNIGGVSKHTNKPTSDPNFPGHRFESSQTRDANGNVVFKETIVRDSAGTVKKVSD